MEPDKPKWDDYIKIFAQEYVDKFNGKMVKSKMFPYDDYDNSIADDFKTWVDTDDFCKTYFPLSDQQKLILWFLIKEVPDEIVIDKSYIKTILKSGYYRDTDKDNLNIFRKYLVKWLLAQDRYTVKDTYIEDKDRLVFNVGTRIKRPMRFYYDENGNQTLL